MESIVDILGWFGTCLLVLGYILISAKKVHGQSISYQLFNLIGSIFLGVNSYYYGALPSVGISIMWIGIGGVTLLQILQSTNQNVSV
ncbi:MAG TPA: hypothetical protein DIT99_26355 [Candidatus Latescibacteria bacterium]|jgi:hypothetical protein|nr:hypothetical protein [Candidatus Latescibacterota bacterium]